MKKKYISILLLLALAETLFYSCAKTGISISKRQHRNGYYLEYFSGNGKILPAINEEKLKELPADIPLQIPAPPENQMQNYPAAVENKSHPIHTNDISIEKRKTTNSKLLKNFIAEKTVPLKNIYENPKKIIRPVSVNKNTASINRDGGGIIWTLVGILILVWLISILMGGWGLGGLIYILLVVALLLAIFRLLELL